MNLPKPYRYSGAVPVVLEDKLSKDTTFQPLIDKLPKSSCNINPNVFDLNEMVSKQPKIPIMDWNSLPNNELDDDTKYTLFSEMYPENSCRGVSLHIGKSKTHAIPSNKVLQQCILEKEDNNVSIGINFTYQDRANLMWIDTTNKVINRYEPQIPGDSSYQAMLDDNIREYFLEYLPEYEYLGNTLKHNYCIKVDDGNNHRQDYCILYAINRINGMNYFEAAEDLSSREEEIFTITKELRDVMGEAVHSLNNNKSLNSLMNGYLLEDSDESEDQ